MRSVSVTESVPFVVPVQPLAEQPFAGNLEPVTQGPWAGWWVWAGRDPFETHTGPYYVARDAQGIVCGFRPQAFNRNGHGMIHGGSLMTFADFSLFMLAAQIAPDRAEEVHGVTVAMTSEFLSPAQEGEILLARGERTGGGRSLAFARGTILAGDRAVLTFSGTIKQFRR